MSELYKKAGVDLKEAENLSAEIASLGKNFQAFTGNVVHNGMKIFNCCDGIGSKIIPLYERGLYKTIATDLVAANLNDMVTKNAQAIAFSDYIAVNKLDSIAITEFIFELKNVLDTCNCKLLGGETSEIPALLKERVIDICGFAIGVSDENYVYENITDGDVVIALKSSGIHANGFSLIRKLHAEGKLSDNDFEKCLEPTYVYYNSVRKLWEKNLIKAAANITGGGIYNNLIRAIPDGYNIELDYSNIKLQGIYQKLLTLCGKEIYEVFNCGVGFCLIARENNIDEIFEICDEFNPFIFGKVVMK